MEFPAGPAKQQSPVILQLKDYRLPSGVSFEWRCSRSLFAFTLSQRLGIFDVPSVQDQAASTVVVTENNVSQSYTIKHVHAHSPGEHYEHRSGDNAAVSHQGRLGDFEFHLVHKADDGCAIVISVLLKVDDQVHYDPDNFLGRFVKSFQSIPGEEPSHTRNIDLAKLLNELGPLNQVTTYRGTLTTLVHDDTHPHEFLGFGRNVRFVILDENPILIAREQLHYCRFQQRDRARRELVATTEDQNEPIFAEPSNKVFDCGLHGEIVSVDRNRPEIAKITLNLLASAAEPTVKRPRK